MSAPAHSNKTARRADPLDAALSAVEAQLTQLGLALQSQDANMIEVAAGALRTALASVATQAPHAPPADAARQQRVRAAAAVLATQREAVMRGHHFAERAVSVLLPQMPQAAAVYGAHGGAERGRSSGLTQA